MSRRAKSISLGAAAAAPPLRNSEPWPRPALPRASSSPSAGRASTISRTSTSTCRATSWSCSPACRARASRRSPSTPSMPRASAATSRSLSAYARQFLEMMQKPDVDQIDGLSPAISIEQKTTSRNPRSTVGTVTEIYDYMRLLFARVGVPYSPATGLPIESQTGQPDGRPRAGAARGHAPLPAGADRARPQGRVPQGAGRADEARLPARQDRRHLPRDRRGPGARQEAQARHRGGGRPHRGRRRHRRPPRRFLPDRARTRRRPRHRRVRGCSASRHERHFSSP